MYKRIPFLFAILALLVSACNTEDTPSPGLSGQVFRVTNTRQYVSSSQTANVDHLAMLIYENGVLKKKEIQNSDDSQYGQFKASLPVGGYEAVFLGYFKDSVLIAEDGPEQLRFTGGYVPNTFMAYQPLSVTEKGSVSESVVLKHMCACFGLRCDDYAEMQDLAAMQVRVSGGYNILNARTGYASAQSEDRVTTYSMTSSSFKDGKRLLVYTYLPAESAYLDITVTALDKNGQEMRTRKFEQVPLQISHRSIYQGKFMSGDDSNPKDEEIKVNYTWTMEIDDPGWTDDAYSY